MKNANQLKGSWILAGLYTAIMFECATMGLLFHATLAELIDHSNIKVYDRESAAVIILTFMVVALIGHLLTIPCLCYGAQCHSPSALVPYLVWRMLLSSIIIAVMIWQAIQRSSSSILFRSALYDKQLPVAVGEIIIGTIFFAITMRAYHEFTTKRLVREKTPDADVFS